MVCVLGFSLSFSQFRMPTGFWCWLRIELVSKGLMMNYLLQEGTYARLYSMQASL